MRENALSCQSFSHWALIELINFCDKTNRCYLDCRHLGAIEPYIFKKKNLTFLFYFKLILDWKFNWLLGPFISKYIYMCLLISWEQHSISNHTNALAILFLKAPFFASYSFYSHKENLSKKFQFHFIFLLKSCQNCVVCKQWTRLLRIGQFM